MPIGRAISAIPPSSSAPIATLIAKDYAAKQRAGIDPDRATPWTDALSATPPHEGSNTTHFSVVDAAGNAVSNTYTLNFSYGVGLVADGTGVLLNNELDDFTAAPGASNAYRPGRIRGQPARPRQAALVVDVANHRAEGRQAGAGDGLARRQPHHLDRAAGDRQCARLPHGCRVRGGGAARCTINGCRTKSGSSTVSPTMCIAALRAKGHTVIEPLGQTSANSIAVTDRMDCSARPIRAPVAPNAAGRVGRSGGGWRICLMTASGSA